MNDHAHDINAEVRRYMMVFGVLLFLTIVTVGVSYLHLNIVGAVILALVIATIKASLVACYFMHLISEQKLIYIVLFFTFIFFLGMLILPIMQSNNTIKGIEHYVVTRDTPAVH